MSRTTIIEHLSNGTVRINLEEVARRREDSLRRIRTIELAEKALLVFGLLGTTFLLVLGASL